MAAKAKPTNIFSLLSEEGDASQKAVAPAAAKPAAPKEAAKPAPAAVAKPAAATGKAPSAGAAKPAAQAKPAKAKQPAGGAAAGGAAPVPARGSDAAAHGDAHFPAGKRDAKRHYSNVPPRQRKEDAYATGANRVYERRSGTGRPITGENKKGGAGKGNWGSITSEVDDAIAASAEQAERKPREPTAEELAEQAAYAAALEAARKEEEEDAKKITYEDYLKNKEKSKFALPEARKPEQNSEWADLVPLKREETDTSPTPKKKETKEGAAKKVPLDQLFNIRAPDSGERGGGRGRGRGGRGGRGGERAEGGRAEGGRGEGGRGRGRGARGGGRGGAPRGGAGPRGQSRGGGNVADLSSQDAFPALPGAPAKATA